VSYLKDGRCTSCDTEPTYAFPNWLNVNYCYCGFRAEIGEQIAREIEASMMFHNGKPVERDRRDLSMLKYAAAIARGEK
jgi:hypothetical protein